MNSKDMKLCVTLNDEIFIKLKSIFRDVRLEELTRDTFLYVACQLQKSGKAKKTKVANFIRTHIDDLVKEYSNEYPLWEARALPYAEEYGYGIADQLTEDIFRDEFWIRKF